MTRLALLLLGIAACILGIWTMPTYAQSAPKCGERAKIVYPLANEYLEAPLMEGIDEQGASIEIWANPDTGTWTVVSRMPGGPTCLIKAGKDFTILPLDPSGVPS